jgi:hypothetical protein
MTTIYHVDIATTITRQIEIEAVSPSHALLEVDQFLAMRALNKTRWPTDPMIGEVRECSSRIVQVKRKG